MQKSVNGRFDAARRAAKDTAQGRGVKVLIRSAGVLVGLLGVIAAVIYQKPEALAIVSRALSEAGVQVERNIPYGPNVRQTLDIYRPPLGTPERNAVIVFLYGGSWSSGSKDYYAFAGHALAVRGFTTVVPDYRLYPDVQFPAFVEDAAAAYVWAEKSLSRDCTRGRPVILAGHSAGGHMAALLALDKSYIAHADPDAARPAALIGLAGPYTFQPTIWPSTKDAFASIADKPDAPRPIMHVSAGAPPALLLHGLADTLVNLKNTRELAAALSAAGTPVETAEYPGIGHMGLVTAISRPLRWRAPVLDTITAFAGRYDQGALTQFSCRRL